MAGPSLGLGAWLPGGLGLRPLTVHVALGHALSQHAGGLLLQCPDVSHAQICPLILPAPGLAVGPQHHPTETCRYRASEQSPLPSEFPCPDVHMPSPRGLLMAPLGTSPAQSHKVGQGKGCPGDGSGNWGICLPAPPPSLPTASSIPLDTPTLSADCTPTPQEARTNACFTLSSGFLLTSSEELTIKR